MMVGLLGILKAGAAYLPLAPDTPPGRLDYMLKDGVIKVLLVHHKTAKNNTFEGRIVNLDDPAVYRGSTANPLPSTRRGISRMSFTRPDRLGDRRA